MSNDQPRPYADQWVIETTFYDFSEARMHVSYRAFGSREEAREALKALRARTSYTDHEILPLVTG